MSSRCRHNQIWWQSTPSFRVQSPTSAIDEQCYRLAIATHYCLCWYWLERQLKWRTRINLYHLMEKLNITPKLIMSRMLTKTLAPLWLRYDYADLYRAVGLYDDQVAIVCCHFYRTLGNRLRSVCFYRSIYAMACVCLSVCLSQVGVLLKRLNVRWRKQRLTIAQGLDFSGAKNLFKIRTGSPQTGAPNVGWVKVGEFK